MLSVFKLRHVLIWTEKAAWLCCPYEYHVYFHLEYLHILWILFSISSEHRTLYKEQHPTWLCNSCSLFPNKGPSVLLRWQLQKAQSWHLTFTYRGEWQQVLHHLAPWQSCLLHSISSSPDTWVVGEMEGPLSVQITSSRLNMPEDGKSSNPVSPLWPAQSLCSSSDLRR